MKTIAMYLPQFHRIAENDEWWGEGFTEWTTVRSATSLFNGQKQPKEPLNDYYYNLLEKDALLWQAELAKKYNVYGFCFYHYWFKDGKRVLEKPAENLLKWKDINMRFSFCWANESWARTWSKEVFKNTWSKKFERQLDNDKDILLDQKYGNEADWKEHFEYLLEFFKDDRYIKIEGKPIFNIFKPEQISCLESMLEKWNEWAVEEGLNGLYIILHNSLNIKSELVNAYCIHEPSYVLELYGKNIIKKNENTKEMNNIYSYDDIWSQIIKQQYLSDKPVYEGGFIDYDDTPRRLKDGLYFEGSSPEKFKKYFGELTRKNLKNGNEITFINAWNEWGEGMYLEPDKENEFGYLEAINEVVNKCKDVKETDLISEELDNDNIKYYKELYNNSSIKLKKFREYFEILNKWMYLKEADKNISEYFLKNNYKKIGLYGLGHLGQHLLEELKDSQIEVRYIVDKKGEIPGCNIPVQKPEEDLDQVDAIIVTVTTEYNEIKNQLKDKVKCPIISLKEVVLEV